MNIGQLRDRVEILVKIITTDNEGLTSISYTSVGSVWAKVDYIGGEIAQKKYGVTEEGISLKIKVRPNPNIVEQNAIAFKGKTYEIRFVAQYPDRYEALLRVIDT